tara:strand:- start:7029 stop:8672 length:1644 start_codon:yes stop_codon:yes gene_type:complete
MKLSTFNLYFHTIKYLKLSQIYWRFKYRFFKSRPSKIREVATNKWLCSWNAPMWSAKLWDGENSFFFLGEKGILRSQNNWVVERKSVLWNYNLHYLDCLNVLGKYNFFEEKKLVKNWIESNKDTDNKSWDAYCLSLRIVNLIKWCSRNNFYSNYVCLSIAHQADVLMTKLEYHILGNHLLTNGKALIFAGVFLRGKIADKFLEKGLKIIDQEINEQFLADGAHFELSPMYHQILMWDICDLVHLSEISNIKKLKVRSAFWRSVLLNAQNWRAAMTHPDGDVAFFNDSSLGIAPPSIIMDEFLNKLGIRVPLPETGLYNLTASGFFSVSQTDGHKLLINACEISPSYQPGHSHADSLSFELSIWSKRFFVNSGTSIYGVSNLRNWQRGTSAHNTLNLGLQDSSQVWGGFRVAKRARIIKRKFYESSHEIVVEAAHDGYHQQSMGGIHYRKWISTQNSLTVIDEIVCEENNQIAHFFLHPDVLVSVKETSRILLCLDKKEISFKVSSGKLEVVSSKWYPKFGVAIKSNCIKVSGFSGSLISSVNWLNNV